MVDRCSIMEYGAVVIRVEIGAGGDMSRARHSA
jgi:hypothetical protein